MVDARDQPRSAQDLMILVHIHLAVYVLCGPVYRCVPGQGLVLIACYAKVNPHEQSHCQRHTSGTSDLAQV